MGAATLNKKRKLKDAEEAVAAPKKTKKSKVPPPVVEPSSDEEEEEDEDEEDVPSDDEDEPEENDEEEDGSEEDGDEEKDEEDDGDDKDEADGEDLAQDNAPLLPPSTDSELFEDMNLSEKTMKAIKEMGFTKMTSIQRSVSIALKGFPPATKRDGNPANPSFRPSHPFLPARMFSVPPRPVQERRWPS